jgi:cobalamin synthase
MILSSASAIGMGLVIWGLEGVMVFLGIGLFSLAFRLFFLKKLKGITGDILGAANEFSELLCLVLLLILR